MSAEKWVCRSTLTSTGLSMFSIKIRLKTFVRKFLEKPYIISRYCPFHPHYILLHHHNMIGLLRIFLLIQSPVVCRKQMTFPSEVLFV